VPPGDQGCLSFEFVGHQTAFLEAASMSIEARHSL
jgi:hypothetical protein